MRRVTFALTVAAVLALATGSAQTPAFEVVSVKPAVPPSPGPGPIRIGVSVTPGRWDASNVTLLNVIRNGYPELATEAQFVGGPDWIRSTRFDIAATTAGDPPRDQIRQMVRTLLAQRFGVKAHVESRSLDAFALVVARSDGRLGPNLRPSTVDCEARAAAIKRGERQPEPPPGPGQ